MQILQDWSQILRCALPVSAQTTSCNYSGFRSLAHVYTAHAHTHALEQKHTQSHACTKSTSTRNADIHSPAPDAAWYVIEVIHSTQPFSKSAPRACKHIIGYIAPEELTKSLLRELAQLRENFDENQALSLTYAHDCVSMCVLLKCVYARVCTPELLKYEQECACMCALLQYAYVFACMCVLLSVCLLIFAKSIPSKVYFQRSPDLLSLFPGEDRDYLYQKETLCDKRYLCEFS